MPRAVPLMLVVLCALLALPLPAAAQAADFATPAFRATWARTDQPVAAGAVTRTWLWGPAPLAAGQQEEYAEAPGGRRLVQYFDKSRMELTDPSRPEAVTNGLLAKELVSGQLQAGNVAFQERWPAAIPVAGDPDDTGGPTYATFKELLTAPPPTPGAPIVATLDRAGTVGSDPGLGRYGATAAELVAETRHAVASPFWAFLQQRGPVLAPGGGTAEGRLFEPTFFATGLPITEAYWARVKVGGQVKDVLAQAFERRVLTYTPSNPEAFRVEMGNVGQHYRAWRYEEAGKPAAPPITKAEDIVLQLTDLPAGYRLREQRPTNDGRGYSRAFENFDLAPTGFVVLFATAVVTPSDAAAAGSLEATVAAFKKENKKAVVQPYPGVGDQAQLMTLDRKEDDVTVRIAIIVFRRAGVVALMQGGALAENSDPAVLARYALIMDERATRLKR